MTIRTLASRTVYENRWMRLREDAIVHPDGAEGVYAVVDKAPAALVVPWDGERVHLVGQHRYTVGRFLWEFPQGAIDTDPPPPPEEVARTELREETGLRAGRLERIGFFYFAYGLSSQGCHAWLATQLEAGKAEPEATEQGLLNRAVTPAELEALIGEGEIADAATLAAWQLAGLGGAAG